jgi:4-carboxymuconolactone decarboxylase
LDFVSRDAQQFPILDMPLDDATRALIRLAVAVARGREDEMVARSREAAAVEVPAVWVDELLLLSMLMVGWPRALGAAAVWRRESGMRAPAADASATESLDDWRARGEALCRVVYGGNYERLRENVRALHPALDLWMVRDGYGRVLSRPGLDLVRREFCVVAQTVVLQTGPQLLSHLKGALNAGASTQLVDEVAKLVEQDVDPAARSLLGEMWSRAGRTQTVKGEQ